MYVTHWPAAGQALAEKFWPGPITLVLPKAPIIAPNVTAGLPTVGVRCPDHPIALALLRAFAGPIVAPSANRSNRVSPTTAEHVRQELGNSVDLILDGGPCRVGIESTVIDLTSTPPKILRPGSISRQDIESLIGPVSSPAAISDISKPSTSPGQNPVHYSPLTPAFRFSPADPPALKKILARLGRRKVFLIIRTPEVAKQLQEETGSTLMLTMPQTADQFAHALYSALRRADQAGADEIWIEQPPEDPAWDAIRDRINRATRPPPS
jgi:L-threonylcarbamoyladenylate synthase